MSPARPWTGWSLPKGTIRTISQVEIISFISERSWTLSLCRGRSRLSCSASTLSPTCGRALGFLRTINREGLHFRWRNSYTQSYILKWLNRDGKRAKSRRWHQVSDLTSRQEFTSSTAVDLRDLPDAGFAGLTRHNNLAYARRVRQSSL